MFIPKGVLPVFLNFKLYVIVDESKIIRVSKTASVSRTWRWLPSHRGHRKRGPAWRRDSSAHRNPRSCKWIRKGSKVHGVCLQQHLQASYSITTKKRRGEGPTAAMAIIMATTTTTTTATTKTIARRRCSAQMPLEKSSSKGARIHQGRLFKLHRFPGESSDQLVNLSSDQRLRKVM